MAVEEWYERLREESRKFMEENQRQWDERQREWDRRRIADEQRLIESPIADQERVRRRLADQEWQLRMQDSDKRFYKSLNEIRVQFGMPLVDYSFGATAEEDRWEGTNVAAATPEEIEVSKQQIRDDGTRGSGSGLFGGSEARSSFNQTPPIDFPANLEEGLGTDNVNHQGTHLANPSAKNSQAPSNDNDVFSGIEGAEDPTISWGITIRGGQEIKLNIDGVEDPKDLQTQLEHPKFEGEIMGIAVEEKQDELQTQFVFPKVNFDPLSSSKIEFVSRETIEIDKAKCGNHANVDVLEKITEFRVISVEFLEIQSAPNVFEKMPGLVGMTIFDPGGGCDVLDYEICEARVIVMVSTGLVDYKSPIDALFSIKCVKDRLFLGPFDRGIASMDVIDIQLRLAMAFVFNPGRAPVIQTAEQGLKMLRRSSKSALKHSLFVLNICCVIVSIWIFDPGGKVAGVDCLELLKSLGLKYG